MEKVEIRIWNAKIAGITDNWTYDISPGGYGGDSFESPEEIIEELECHAEALNAGLKNIRIER